MSNRITAAVILGVLVGRQISAEGVSPTLSMLVEKAELTSGSTWHAAGQTTHSVSHYGLAKINGYGIELYQRLEAETGKPVISSNQAMLFAALQALGMDTGVVKCGRLFLQPAAA